MAGSVAAVIPTLGRSPLLPRCLQALRAEGERAEVNLLIVLVDQSPEPTKLPTEAAALVDHLLRLEHNLGFAGGTNRGIEQGLEAATEVAWVATVNDDAVVQPGWLEALLQALEDQPEAAAAQGLNLSLDGEWVDGAGIAWNGWHQAVQIGHGESADEWRGEEVATEIFGVSATAALYRRQALEAVRLPVGDLFDNTLESYYEDVDLACRLQAAGRQALLVPRAQALHGASVTGRTLGPGGIGRLKRLRGNRYRVLARQPGFLTRLPKAVVRDVLDLGKAVGTLRWGEAWGVVLGWGWALDPFRRPPSQNPPSVPPLRKVVATDGRDSRRAEADMRFPLLRKGGSRKAGRGTEGVGASAIVIHWRNEDLLERLLESWPKDARWELLIVDNSDSTEELEERFGGEAVRWVHRGANLGFAGGVNRGLAEARGEAVLILNPDVHPEPPSDPATLENLLDGLEAHPQAAGLAPRLLGEDGASQAAWQLRRLQGPLGLILQTLLVPTGGGPAEEPPEGTAIEQPAAAALLIRRRVLEALGGLDEDFQPAWFEDVDLARRLRDRGEVLRYWPRATFRHRLGATVPKLGYGAFLWVYYRNLEHYLRKHHGRFWASLSRVTLLLGMGLRLLLLPLRVPQRANHRREAARGLLRVMAGCLTGWRSHSRHNARSHA